MENSVSSGTSDYTAKYTDFLNRAPSPFHAAEVAASQLQADGFRRVEEKGTWPAEPGRYFVVRGGALAAWIVPSKLSENAGFSIFGCHTDSPCFKLKPVPQHSGRDGWGQLAVEVYGGMIYNSWLDRELILAGTVYDKAGHPHLVETGPLARIPQLAIHLDRKVNEGLKLDPQKHLRPVWTVDDDQASIVDVLAEAAGLESAADVVSWDIFLVPAQPAEVFGNSEQFIAARRQDNLSSVFAGLQGLLEASETQDGRHIPVLIAFDHEEVGSASRTGAAGPFLQDILTRTASALGNSAEGLARMLATSSCLSADAGHSVHPNYADMHDDDTRPVLGRGPLLKINANQRYSSEGESIALWRRVCAAADVPSQDFVSSNAVPCGSTIGPITATRLGLLTVDVGVGMLSMHSAREMTHTADIGYLTRVANTYLSGTHLEGSSAS